VEDQDGTGHIRGTPGGGQRHASAEQPLEHARQRLTFLAAASEALGSSLDYERTLGQVARMAVPALADWCIVDLLESDGSLRRVAATHSDPARAEVMRRLTERYPSIPAESSHTAQRVRRSGQAWFDPDVREERFVAEARSEEHLGLLRQLGFSGEIVVPLTSRERVLGTLTLVAGMGRARYTTDDLDLAVELARRCAVAIDNARLYAEAQEQTAIHVRLNAELRDLIEAEKAARTRAALLATVSQTLDAARLDRNAVLNAVARHTAQILGDLCIVALIDSDGELLIPVAVEHANQRSAELVRHLLEETPLRVGQGASGRVAHTGIPLLIRSGDEAELRTVVDPRYRALIDDSGAQSMLIVPLRASDRIIGTLGLTRDRSGRPYTEDDRSLLEEIAARAALAIHNAQLHAAAEAAVAGRDEFISVAAHDLRTPIASLRGYAQLALRHLGTDNPDLERVRRSVSQVLEQTGRLTRMMERLLDVARLEGGKVRLERTETDVASLISDVVAACQAAQPERNIVLRTERLFACVDPVRLEQVVTNLLDNALKFSPPAAPVEVDVEGEPDQVRITVRDYGPGVPVARRARLFERYFQAHEPQADLGVGLGLYISRHFVELHDGSIALESPPDGGSRFVVLLPRNVDGARVMIA
jgi:signal transduction histidine kinase